MVVFRRAQLSDLDAIYNLAQQTSPGMTTLPKDKLVLAGRLELSSTSFARKVIKPKDEYYLFVLEDVVQKKIVGTAGIEALLGSTYPFYSFRRFKRTKIHNTLNIHVTHDLLTLVNDLEGSSEICTLFLSHDYRRQYHGLLLSRARFLFIKAFPERFSDYVVAEIRGVFNEKGNSPFWSTVMKHFFPMTFTKADILSLSSDKQFIADLMPDFPLYINMFPKSIQATIAVPHPSTVSAMRILLNEGFAFKQCLDIFEAGPTIESDRQHIHTIASSKILKVKTILTDINNEKLYIIANHALEFRAIVSRIIIDDNQNCTLAKEDAAILGVDKGDVLSVCPLLHTTGN